MLVSIITQWLCLFQQQWPMAKNAPETSKLNRERVSPVRKRTESLKDSWAAFQTSSSPPVIERMRCKAVESHRCPLIKANVQYRDVSWRIVWRAQWQQTLLVNFVLFSPHHFIYLLSFSFIKLVQQWMKPPGWSKAQLYFSQILKGTINLKKPGKDTCKGYNS